MHRIEAEFEIVTPMFLAGADPKGSAELRAASIKGALRFWWRALAWGRLGSLVKVHEDEKRIFGSSDGGQGCFLLRIVESDYQILEAKNQTVLKDETERVVRPGARYLGYGLVEAFASRPRNVLAGQLIRPCICAGGRFRLELRFKQLAHDLASVLDALKLLGLIGGLGARTRRGWGSIALKEIKAVGDVLPLPSTPDEYQRVVRDLITAHPLATARPPYSAFFDKACVLILREGSAALGVLDDLGDTFQLFRGWRHPPDCPRHQAAEQNFAHDHHGSKAQGVWTIPAGSFDSHRAYPAVDQAHPLRVEFGLPHNYAQWLKLEAEGHDRRASPLLFHIHPVGDNYCAVATFFPTPFLPNVAGRGPERIKIKLRAGAGWHDTDVDSHVDYGAIERFLLGFTPPGSTSKRDYFAGTRKVIL